MLTKHDTTNVCRKKNYMHRKFMDFKKKNYMHRKYTLMCARRKITCIESTWISSSLMCARRRITCIESAWISSSLILKEINGAKCLGENAWR